MAYFKALWRDLFTGPEKIMKKLNQDYRSQKFEPRTSLIRTENADRYVATFDNDRDVNDRPTELLTTLLNTNKINTLRGFCPQANYTDRATVACRRS
jgi:hypothetical protein